MRYSIFISLLIPLFVLEVGRVQAQELGNLDPEAVEEAKSIAVDSIFAHLKEGQGDMLANWITDQVHSGASGTSRMEQVNKFKSQFSMITQGSPESPFGEIDGYDLIQKSRLPGTDRYFRLTYMTYHREAPLVWEMHFYVRPDGETGLNYIQFNGKNPFTYMTTSDMLIENYYSMY